MKMETMPVIRTTSPRMITQEMVMKIPRVRVLYQGMSWVVMVRQRVMTTPIPQQGNATKKMMLD